MLSSYRWRLFFLFLLKLDLRLFGLPAAVCFFAPLVWIFLLGVRHCAHGHFTTFQVWSSAFCSDHRKHAGLSFFNSNYSWIMEIKASRHSFISLENLTFNSLASPTVR